MNPLVSQLEQLVRDYLASRNDSLLGSIAAIASQLVNQLTTLSDTDRGRVVEALRNLLTNLQPSLAVPGVLAAGFGTQLAFAAPAAPISLVLVAGGGATGGGTIAIAPGSVVPAGFGGGGAAAIGTAVVGAIVPASVGLLLAGAVAFPFIGFYALYLAFLGVKEALRAIAALKEKVLDLFLRAFGDKILMEAFDPDVTACVVLAWNRITNELAAEFKKLEDALKQGTGTPPNFLEDLFQRINRLLALYIQLLADCGVNRLDVIAKVAVLKQTYKTAFNFNGARLPAGPALSTALLEEARNGLRRETLEGNVSGFHRKGGMSYEEIGDDTAENPDITNEDPSAPVSLEEVDVDPNLELDAFTNGQLELRKKTLQRFIDELLAAIAELDTEIARLRGSDDPGDQDRLGRLLVGRDQAVRDLRKTKAALRNAHIEYRARLLEAGQNQMADQLLEAIQVIDPRNPERVFSTAETDARRAVVRTFSMRPISGDLG